MYQKVFIFFKLSVVLAIYLFPSCKLSRTEAQIPCTNVIDSTAIKLVEAAMKRTKTHVTYDPSYYSIDYPGGDIPVDKGVCTDVVIRSYREIGIDLQKEVHEDMILHFDLYPKKWGLSTTDKNIDHRRVPNLMKFFSRYGQELPTTKTDSLYRAGHIVCWDLGNGITHIGIVVCQIAKDTGRPMIVHNIGRGPEMEDILYDFRIIGHYRYLPRLPLP